MSEQQNDSTLPQAAAMPQKDNAVRWNQELAGDATLIRVEKQGHSLRVVLAEHLSKKAANLFQEDISREIDDPSQWLFLIEGKDSGVHESDIAAAIAKQKNIPLEDPIFHPFQADIIELYLQSGQAIKSKKVVMGQLAVNLANARGNGDLEEVAYLLDLESADDVLSYILIATADQKNDREGYSTFQKQLNSNLTRISNYVSAQVLDYYLRKYSDKPNVALYMGKAHEDVIALDKESIPESLRFSDEQIEQMIRDKEAAHTRTLLRSFGLDIPKRKEQVHEERQTQREISASFQEKMSLTEKVSQILQEIPGASERLRGAILHWCRNIFQLEYVHHEGYAKYLTSENSLHQIWGAADHLAVLVETAMKEKRKLSPLEIEIIRGEIRTATINRSSSHPVAGESDELYILADNIPVLEQIIWELNQ